VRLGIGIGLNIGGDGRGGVASPNARLTIPAQAAALTGFVTYVSLATMPAGFWSFVNSDGGNIRVYSSDGVTLIPHDLVWCNPTTKRGDLYFKADLSNVAPNIFYVKCIDPGNSKLAVGDANGRNAVWSAYAYVLDTYDMADRTGGGVTITLTQCEVDQWDKVSVSPTIVGHQGVTRDANYRYVVDTDGLRKYNLDWSGPVLTNSTPIAQTGLATVDHLGAPAIYNGVMYLPLVKYPDAVFASQYIVAFDPATLTFLQSWDVSDIKADLSAICFDPNGICEIANYVVAPTKIYRRDPTNGFSALSDITLSSPVINMQGIGWYNGKRLISTDIGATAPNGAIWSTRADGTVEGIVYQAGLAGSSRPLEGFVLYGDELSIMTNHSTTPYALILQPTLNIGMESWLRLAADNINSRGVTGTVTKLTDWTLETSFYVKAIAASYAQALVSYGPNQTADTARASTGIRGNGDSTFFLWNSTDSFLSTAVVPALDRKYKSVATNLSTTRRTIYLGDGLTSVVSAVDNTVSQRPTGTPEVLYIGMEDASLAAPWPGYINRVRLRTGEISATEAAAAITNEMAPTGFYSATAA
jgi:hypothetical protein